MKERKQVSEFYFLTFRSHSWASVAVPFFVVQCFVFYQSPLILTELFQHDLINASYLTACYLYQVMMTLHILNDVAYDAESTQNKTYVIIASLKSVQQWVN